MQPTSVQLQTANRLLVTFSTAMAALLPEVRFIQETNESLIKGKPITGDDHVRLCIAALKLHDAVDQGVVPLLSGFPYLNTPVPGSK